MRTMGHGVARPLLLLLLLALANALLAAASAEHTPVFRVVRSVDAVVAAVERSRHVSAVLLVSSGSDATLQGLAGENDGRGDDLALVGALEAQFPHVRKIAQSLEGAVDFVVADIADAKAVTKKWNVAQLPALIVYKDAPKKNPYTGEMYRDAQLTPVAVLQQPRELKKLLRESIPATYVAEWSALDGVTTLADVQKQRQDAGNSLVVLVSKQTAASPLFRALSVEFDGRGLAFAYVNQEEAVAQEAMNAWGVDKLPAIVVVTSRDNLDERVVFQDEAKMRKYADLKALVEPFASTVDESASGEDKTASEKKASRSEMPMLTSANFDSNVLDSKLVWIVSFMDAETVASTDKKEWRKLMNEIQKKSGIVAVGAVNCATDAELCGKYGGAGAVRVFPIRQDTTTGEIERGDMFEDVFKTVDDAKQPAIESLPDVVRVMGSAAEVNAFISRALIEKAMPVLLVTSKLETPPILKSLALSFPSQHIAVGVVSDLDPQVKQMFALPPSSKSSFLSLIAVDEKQRQAEGQPANASPFGVILYDKKTMGPFTYPNMVRYLMSVLSQYPHPKPQPQAGEGDAEFASGAAVDSVVVNDDVPYLREDNLDVLCSGNKICAIGFFEGHVDTLNDEDSPLSKAVGVLRQVAAKSRKARQPFLFMWTNGKCQSAFAESFGVGAFQMPTVVVYSPSKARYATNIGVFDEDNTAGFLKGVMLGKIPTIPLNEVAALRGECTLEEISDSATATALEEDNDEDLGDFLSEIIGDEEEQRRQLEEELAKERKANKKETTKKDKKKKKKKTKGKKKTNDDHDEL